MRLDPGTRGGAYLIEAEDKRMELLCRLVLSKMGSRRLCIGPIFEGTFNTEVS